MNLVPVFLKISLVLSVISQNEVCGALNLLRPSYWLRKLPIDSLNPLNIFKKATTPTPTTTESETTVKTMVVEVEKKIFALPSIIQSYFEPGDVQAKENYIISPVSIAILLGELLIGTDGWPHDCLTKAMGLNQRIRRQVYLYEESNQALYDDKIYHSSYHYRLSILVRHEQSNEEEDKVKLDNALFHNQDVNIIDQFKTKVNRFYKPAIIPIDVNNINNSPDPIQQWSGDNLKVDVAKRTTTLVDAQMGSILLNTFLLNTTWQIPLKKVRRKEKFCIKPYKSVKVRYLQGTINNAVYCDSEDFTLVGVPLNHKKTQLYILLPKGNDFVKYNIRRFSETLNNYEQFHDILEHDTELRDVKLKVPNIFSQFIEFDIMKPLLNFINDENELAGKPRVEDIELNTAAIDLKINNVLQHVYFSINNSSGQTTPSKILMKSLAEQQPHQKNPPTIFDPTIPPINITTIPDFSGWPIPLSAQIPFKDANEELSSFDQLMQKILADAISRGRRNVGATGSKDSLVEFEVTRPFLFIIMDQATHLVLVWGSISEPQKLQ